MNQAIPEQTVQDILHKIDVVDLIGEYVQLRKSGKNFLGLCPFHSEKTPSFSVSAEKQLYHCFGCGAGGNAFTFLMDMEGYSFTQALEYLGDTVDIRVGPLTRSRSRKQEDDDERELMAKAHHLAAQLFQHMLTERKEGSQALDYLQQRGFSMRTIRAFQLGFAPDSWDFLTNFLAKRDFPLQIMEKGGLLAKTDHGDRYFDRFRGRVMFPIRNRQGKVIAFQGRAVGDAQPKYLNSPETVLFHKHRQLFHFDQARLEIRQKQKALLLEGCMDVLSVYQAGITYGTATLGTSLSEEQARMIGRHSREVIICYDGDQAGVEATRRAAALFRDQECLVKVAVLPRGDDPDDYIQKHGGSHFERQILGGAKAYTAFELEMLKRDRDLHDEGERLAYIHSALEVISELRRAVERDHYLRQLAEEFTLSLDALKQEQWQIYKHKMRQKKDNAYQGWHTRNNENKRLPRGRLLPAYQNAERNLLAHMLRDEQVAKEVEERVGSSFHVDEHSALAAYIYAYYAAGHHPDIRLFISRLQDRELIQLASEISTFSLPPSLAESELEDYIRQIEQYSIQREMEQKEEQKKLAERDGDVLQAAKIAMEVLNMKKELYDKDRISFGDHRKEGE